MTHVHLNGALVPEGEARISPFDRGFLLGDGIFETFRAYRGRPFGLDEHLARLGASARITGIPFPGDLAARVDALLEANDLRGTDAAVRITLTRGPGGRGSSPKGAGPPTVLVTALPVQVPPETYEKGLRLAVAGRRRIPQDALESPVKSTNYLVHVLARMEAEARGADDALFVDGDGFVVEATQANVFALVGDVLLTPPLESGCLPGATRGALLRLAPRLGLEAREAPLSVRTLQEADEAFLTASVTEVAPVVQIEAKRIGNGRPGPRTRALHEAYRGLATGQG